MGRPKISDEEWSRRDTWASSIQVHVFEAQQVAEAWQRTIDQDVLDARGAGLSWEEIAAALGVTRQAAARRYAGRDPGPDPDDPTPDE